MKKIVIYDDEIETDQTGYHMTWDYFIDLMEELIWEVIKPENLVNQEKGQTLTNSITTTTTKQYRSKNYVNAGK